MKQNAIAVLLFVMSGLAMAGEGMPNYPKTQQNVESGKTRAEVVAELMKWKADAAAQKAAKELYTGGSK